MMYVETETKARQATNKHLPFLYSAVQHVYIYIYIIIHNYIHNFSGIKMSALRI